ncbi:TIR domain-containing protein [Streptomyces polygonati]|uniref:TIR domain-containing protein n=1 Tax=Streptomyces polygonati TaxID=1617087 RepID=A0ABV8HK60_9ACTN
MNAPTEISSYFQVPDRHVAQHFAWDPGEERLAICCVDSDNLSSSNKILVYERGPHSYAWWNIPAEKVAWAPRGQRIATAYGNQVSTWNLETGQVESMGSLTHHVFSLSWSGDGTSIAVGSRGGGMELLDAENLAPVRRLPDTGGNTALAWSARGDLAWGNAGALWVIGAGLTDVPRTISLAGLKMRLTALAWSPDGGMLAGCGGDSSVRIWAVRDSGPAEERVLENAHGIPLVGVGFTADGAMLYVMDTSGRYQFWDLASWAAVSTIEGTLAATPLRPFGKVLAATGELVHADLSGTAVSFSSVPANVPSASQPPVQYKNAKVVVVGDTGVGKSGLSLVLSQQAFMPTESTHGRHVWTLERETVQTVAYTKEIRESHLWDLAGQPGYRLVHRLSLRDTTVALVVFDSRSETDPFRGISYWARALDQSAGDSALHKVLVSARSDRGGLSASDQRTRLIVEQFGFSAYFETSAKSGVNVSELRAAILDSIDWDRVPTIVAPRIFFQVQQFLWREKEMGSLLASKRELYDQFQALVGEVDDTVFDVCLSRLQTAGLVAKVTFQDRWLLQPEALDSYVASLGHAARAEPDGLGFISERSAISGEFEHEEIAQGNDESVMLLTAVEEVVGRGLAYRTPTEKGPMLVFPSEIRLDAPDLPGTYTPTVSFEFTGPVSAIYATIAVRLINSLAFAQHSLFRNAIVLTGSTPAQVCGFFVEYPDAFDDSAGRLVAFFGDRTEKELKLQFLRYIHTQIQQLALPDSVDRQRVYQCPDGHPTVSPSIVSLSRKEGRTSVPCPLCGHMMPLDELVEEVSVSDRATEHWAKESEHQQERQSRLAVLPAREREHRFHVFISYNSADRAQIERLNAALREEGIAPWVDDETIKAGTQYIPQLEEILDTVPAMVVAIGPHSMGRWQLQEYSVFLQRHVEARLNTNPARLIPVLLPGGPDKSSLPAFLRNFHIIDLREGVGGAKGAEGLKHLSSTILATGSELEVRA